MSTSANKIVRHLKIQEIYNSSGNKVPIIRISGKWLIELGFKVGGTVTIKIRERLLVIETIEEDLKEFITCKTQLKTVKKTLEELSAGFKKILKYSQEN